MQILKKSDIQHSGRMIMIYGPTGCGKTTSILQSAPDPILYIQTETRPLGPSLEAANRPDLKIHIAPYVSWIDLIGFVSTPKKIDSYATVVSDSFSHLMTIGLSTEIEDEAFESRTADERSRKPLVSQTKMSQEGFGGLSSHMFRLTAALGRLSQQGKIVIVTALLQENPKWDRELAAAPALKGREYPTNMPGFFDLIGLVQTRSDENGNPIYPPLCKFESPDDSFVAKFTGVKPPGTKAWGELDFRKILKLDEKGGGK